MHISPFPHLATLLGPLFLGLLPTFIEIHNVFYEKLSSADPDISDTSGPNRAARLTQEGKPARAAFSEFELWSLSVRIPIEGR